MIERDSLGLAPGTAGKTSLCGSLFFVAVMKWCMNGRKVTLERGAADDGGLMT